MRDHYHFPILKTLWTRSVKAGKKLFNEKTKQKTKKQHIVANPHDWITLNFKQGKKVLLHYGKHSSLPIRFHKCRPDCMPI